MSTIDHQQAAVLAGAEALWKADPTCFGAPAPKTSDEWADETTGYPEDSRAVITAAAPHLRAAWEQPIRELHRPVHAVFSWADGPRYEEPCETCHGAPGVHECGCWADTQLEYVCAECHRLGSGSKGVYDYTWPCPTIALLEGGGE